MRQVALTTTDNPHDPFTDYAAWNAYDVAAGYHTAEFLGRIVKDSDQYSDADQEKAIENAVDECVAENTIGIYRKVVREVPEDERYLNS